MLTPDYSVILKRHLNSPDFDRSFNYCSTLGKIQYLERYTRPKISYIAHQLARFSSSPKKEHGQAMRRLGRYLRETRTQGLYLNPDPSKQLEIHVDANYVGDWDTEDANCPENARSRHG